MLWDKVGEAGAEPKALGPLPEWDLADLYPGRDSPELRRDLEALASDAASFRARYEGKLAALSGGELGAAVAEYERLQEIAGRIMSYADLLRAGNVADPAIAQFFQTMHERINAVATELLFFTLELNRLDDAALDAKLADPALAHYRPWLRDVRAMRPYQLSDELEKLLLEKSVAGRAAWITAVRRDRRRTALSVPRARADRGRGDAPACPTRTARCGARRRCRSARCSARTAASSR